MIPALLKHSFLVPTVCSLMVLALTGCAGKSAVPEQPAAATNSVPAPKISFGAPCTMDQAETLLNQASTAPAKALEGAACAVSVLNAADETGEISGARKKSFRTLAEQGYRAAGIAAQTWPENGLARYLTAYLAGFTARLNPLKGLDLVPVIEQEALRAAQLDPALDHSGPDRMLGNLYLSAPEPPLSIGDIGKALDHFEKAVHNAGGFPPNRLGAARAAAMDEEPGDACRELAEYYRLTGTTPDKKTAAELLSGLCSGMSRQ